MMKGNISMFFNRHNEESERICVRCSIPMIKNVKYMNTCVEKQFGMQSAQIVVM